jgi:hypothetical protein
VPDAADTDGRRVWTAKAAAVAAHRELTGHDDPATALGRAPKPGQVEEYASWRAAWSALGRSEADRDELELSDGQLRVRIRTAEREQAWAPPYVAQELAGTRQATAAHRGTATLRTAEAAAATDTRERERLHQEAAEAAALADVLDQRAADLAVADEARAQWLAHTAWTRAATDRATDELTARGLASAAVDEEVTAAEWLDAHRAADRDEAPYRAITDEADLADIADARTADVRSVEIAADRGRADSGEEETAAEEVDIRQEAVDEKPAAEHDTVQVATAEDTAEAVRRAQRALIEIKQRRVAEERHAAEEARSEQLTRWRTDDAAAQVAAADREPAADGAPALGVGGEDW